MTRQVFRHTQCLDDLIEIGDYLSQQSLAVADRFLDAVEAALTLLADEPGVGTLREFSHPDLAGVRSWPIRGFENFLIFYRETPGGIEVIRFLHGARDIDAVLNQDT